MTSPACTRSRRESTDQIKTAPRGRRHGSHAIAWFRRPYGGRTADAVRHRGREWTYADAPRNRMRRTPCHGRNIHASDGTNGATSATSIREPGAVLQGRLSSSSPSPLPTGRVALLHYILHRSNFAMVLSLNFSRPRQNFAGAKYLKQW